jgi:hypothetical protein
MLHIAAVGHCKSAEMHFGRVATSSVSLQPFCDRRKSGFPLSTNGAVDGGSQNGGGSGVACDRNDRFPVSMPCKAICSIQRGR